MQIARLFEMVYLLLEKRQMTARELAERFEISTRTVYRDVETLSQAGIPLYTTKGKGGGIGITEGFVLNKSLLSRREQMEILAALQSQSATGDKANEETLQKLTSFFRTSVEDWIRVDFSDWNNSDLFEQVKAAVLERREISFRYYGRNGDSIRRKVRPFQLWFKHKSWYLHAFCLERNANRLFKLNRMQEFELLEPFHEEISIPEEEEPMSSGSTSYIVAELWAHSDLAYRIYDEFGPDCIKRNDDGSFLITCPFAEDEWVYGYILSFGEKLRVTGPPHLVEVMKKKTRELSEHYI
ncbi:MAG: helix-turn-helix transcriptional regulator [Oscillospiraceae bacterium]